MTTEPSNRTDASALNAHFLFVSATTTSARPIRIGRCANGSNEKRCNFQRFPCTVAKDISPS